MKHLQTYKEQNEFCNESLRDKMKPKSEDEIELSIPKNLSPQEKLEFGTYYGLLSLVKDALEEGADIHKDNDHELVVAGQRGQTEIAEYLISKGLNVNNNKDAAFFHACMNGHFSTVKMFIDHGINVNTNQNIALECAIKYDDIDMVKYLIEKGATVLKHFRYYAHKNNNFEMTEYLVSKMTTNESLRDKMTAKVISPEIKQNLLKTLDDISFLPLSNLETSDTFIHKESLKTISNILKSDINDLYYIDTRLKNYYIFKDTFKSFINSDYFSYDDGEYDYFINENFKIVWCDHDNYYEQTIDMYIIDLSFLKKTIQNL